jgi:predicted lipoprotein
MFAAEAFAEPSARVQAADAGPWHVLDRPSSVRGAVEGLVVDNDEPSVPGQVDVALDGVGAQVEGPAEGGHRIFRGVGHGAPVAYNKGEGKHK